MSIRTRLLLLVLAVWLPAAIAFGLLARATYEREAAAAEIGVQQQAQALSLMIEREIDKRAVIARTLSATGALREHDLESFYQMAKLATQATGNSAVLVDHKAVLVNTALSEGVTKPAPRMPGAPMVVGEPEAFFYAYVPVLKQPVIAVMAPDLSHSPPKYNVGVVFSPSVIQTLLTEQNYFDKGTAAVLDRDHRVVARNRDPQKWLGKPARGDIRQRIDTGDVGFAASVTLDGIVSQSFVTAPNRYGWSTVVSIPQDALTGAAWQATFRALAAAGGLLLIGLMIALYAGRRISGPILALKNAASSLGHDRIPPRLITGVSEADLVSEALHEAGLRSLEATRRLEERVTQAVDQAQDAQAKLLDAQKHEAIGRLTGGLAHDFNNLLQTVSTALQVLDGAARQEPQRRVLVAAQRACAKAASLVRQMLTFGRSDPLDPQPIDLNDFLLSTRELTGKAVGQHISLSAAIAPDTPALYVDPTQLELALLNLVFNARDAMPGGGHIHITARPAHPSETRGLDGAGPFVWLEVADDGTGMDERAKAYAFEPYFTTKRIGAGTGLGLAQVKSFARQSGGDALLESQLGQGTRVAMLLPTCQTPQDNHFPSEAGPQPGDITPLAVLMVEDDPLVASVVAPALEAAGHVVQLCQTADEAQALLEQGWQGDALFTDVVMPGKLSGMDLVAWCRAHRPELHAVVATGYTPQQVSPEVTLLRKPYEMDDLLMALESGEG